MDGAGGSRSQTSERPRIHLLSVEKSWHLSIASINNASECNTGLFFREAACYSPSTSWPSSGQRASARASTTTPVIAKHDKGMFNARNNEKFEKEA